jgi:hypothetical protein
MNRLIPTITGLAFAASVLTGCGGGPTSQAKPAPTVTVQAPNATQAPTTPSAAAPAPADTQSSAPVISFVMPNMVGKDLQSAQDEVQTHGIFLSNSHDLLGSRMQVLDSNWQVCNQSPVAGAAVKGQDSDLEGTIDFGVVKLTETCR